jgi:hypothetical protein
MIKGFTSGGVRRILLLVWQICLVFLILFWLFPVTYRSNRLLIVLLITLVWAGALWLWNAKWLRVGSVGLLTVIVLAIFLPGRIPEPNAFRSDYVKALKKYEGTTYVWGGENRFGIDCSGLVRRGLIDASLKKGVVSVNPALVRTSFSMRWYDCSAKALMEEYRGQTRRLFSANSIQALDHSKLLPGDFAVTSTGVHTLAYLGNESWIEADPGPHRVLIVNAKENNGWLKIPVELMRWKIFETNPQSTL